MDLLFKRYASPISYIQGLIDAGMLVEGIRSIYEKDNEDKMWEMYLSFPQDVSFNEWKKRIETTPKKKAALSDNELKAALDKTQNILANFHLKEGE